MSEKRDKLTLRFDKSEKIINIINIVTVIIANCLNFYTQWSEMLSASYATLAVLFIIEDILLVYSLCKFKGTMQTLNENGYKTQLKTTLFWIHASNMIFYAILFTLMLFLYTDVKASQRCLEGEIKKCKSEKEIG